MRILRRRAVALARPESGWPRMPNAYSFRVGAGVLRNEPEMLPMGDDQSSRGVLGRLLPSPAQAGVGASFNDTTGGRPLQERVRPVATRSLSWGSSTLASSTRRRRISRSAECEWEREWRIRLGAIAHVSGNRASSWRLSRSLTKSSSCAVLLSTSCRVERG